AHITWDAPEVDGGAPVNNYIIERRETSMRAYKTVTSKCNKTSYKITNLEEGMLYYFRVLPENIYGIGEPRETPDAVLVCEVPLPPSKLEVVDVTKSSVSLGWEKPEHDGGSRLTGYIVEACKAGTDKWMKVATLKLTDYEYTIDKLNESEQKGQSGNLCRHPSLAFPAAYPILLKTKDTSSVFQHKTVTASVNHW
uniref:Fibronectin type-III domain-containing protein n=1 Tax=Astyanax mexicanus TaxID=7994 RepID=A0A3B1IG93_ASTMX